VTRYSTLFTQPAAPAQPRLAVLLLPLARAVPAVAGRLRFGLLAAMVAAVIPHHRPTPTVPVGPASICNLLRLGEVRRVTRSDAFPELLSALKRMHNFNIASMRVRSHGDSKILNDIWSVAHGTFDQSLEIVGIRLLDGYLPKRGRVILGSPLYLAS